MRFDGAAAAALLNGDSLAAEVRADERRLRALGVHMVPTFILPAGRLVVGAEEPAILAAAMRAAA